MNKRRVGIYGGSFDPPHYGHVSVITGVLKERPEVSEIWVMTSPGNPQKTTQTSFKDRYEMTKLMCEYINDPRVIPCDIEPCLPGPPWYTSETLRYLRETYPSMDFSLIIGQDCLESFRTWHSWIDIINNHRLYVCPRVTDKGLDPEDAVQGPLGDIVWLKSVPIRASSSAIRGGYRYFENLIPKNVYKYLTDHSLYVDGLPFKNL